jgi:hypothetical protein
MAQIINNRIYLEVGEEKNIKGVDCVCRATIKANGCRNCVLRGSFVRVCNEYACMPPERPDGKFVIFIQK